MALASIDDFAPEGTEAGVGLALQEESGRYLFFLAGSRHHCPAGELFYAGIGGHREPGESWTACARREAREEIDCPARLLDAAVSWHLPYGRPASEVQLADRPRPLALYEMIHPEETPRAGELYRLVIYRAVLAGDPGSLRPEEVRAVLALTREQVLRGPTRRPTLARLLAEGAAVLAWAEPPDEATRLYPLGTAAALALVLALEDRRS
jgi:8-oxo-dGTP pyrophosphatase MutT (NUDIX family)